jgi:hypothetical protein
MTNTPESDNMKTLTELAKEQGAGSASADYAALLFKGNILFQDEAQLLATFNAWSSQQAKLTTSQVSEPVGVIIVGNNNVANDIRFMYKHLTYMDAGEYPIYLHPPTTPQEAISPAIAEYIKRLEDLAISGQTYPLGTERVVSAINSKPTGLE